MFDEGEDFMYKLFGISTRTQESIDYWGDEDLGFGTLQAAKRTR